MKKNITINLCGRLYQIDEDAYELLSHYTDTLRNYFRKQEGGEEIANDIEERIAELLDDLKSQGIQAITIEHVQDIIQRIGQVDEIAGDGTSDTSNGAGSQTGGNSSSAAGGGEEPLNGKKFYRDSQNKMLAGVLAGCSHYFGGSVNAWRWGYVAACVLWCIIHGGIPFSTGPLFGFALTFITMPVLFLPVVPYILAAVFAPETQTPEDVLRMKGKKVNPQTLTEEVRESNAAKSTDDGKQIWNIFVGILTIGVSTCLTIGFIVALCFFVAWLAAPDLMAEAWWDVYEQEVWERLIQPVTFCGLMLLTSIAILLYCSIHAAVSSFGKTPSMSTKQRIIWFLLWVASLAGFIGSCVYAANQYNKAYHALRERQEAERQAWEEAHPETTETDSIAEEPDSLQIDSLTDDSVAPFIVLPRDSVILDTVKLPTSEIRRTNRARKMNRVRNSRNIRRTRRNY